MIRSKIISFALYFFAAIVFAASFEYTVQKGETLTSISHDYSVTIDAICDENGIQKDTVLKAGQKLKIPAQAQLMPAVEAAKTETYKVARDDTLFSIARKFSMSVPDLKELNNLSTDTIKAGQSLKVYTAQAESIDPRNYAGKQGDTSLLWPVKPTSVTYVTGKIFGVQLGANKNEDVTSISGGMVMYSGLYRGFGQVVFVQNSTGHVYVYTGLTSVAVQRGDKVSLGSPLGKTGVDALNGKSQITFMVYKNGKPMDPAAAPRG